ncbi:unnamed protein product [Rotaria sordida]|uniref:Elongation of very long chain fatty acids protein n=1 Tax=Rotaria sordida TaxID=392033 RepID=A0A819WXN4_9BILA|nr:unnamed protein product [Rotaria sordida]CAF1457745.1 unnamed protein product [Rotaria sordida]CAF4106578.1 unnamed protein product [Rotaria sordida]CAF4132081.1 unnamed protein product [Rotaria sordida]
MLKHLLPQGSDPITHSWFLCSSPWPMIIITIGYLLSIPYGKQWMSIHSKAYNLRLAIVIYNFLAVLINAYVVILSVRTLTLKSYRVYCQGVMHDKEDIYLAKAVWWYYISKAFEFWDTWFFILTKKFSHISILHVYHHSTMFPLWYLAAHYAPGGEVVSPVIVNACVHVIMYLYYALTIMHIQRKRLAQVKLFVTAIQISQFIAAAIGCVFRFHAMLFKGDQSCYDYPVIFVLLFLIHSISLLFLFVNYFLQEYIWKKNSKYYEQKTNPTKKNGYITHDKHQ